jgi:hypothetical protein
MQPLRPASLFTVPYNFVDIGVDGRSGTADDRNLTFYGIPNAGIPEASQVVMTVDQYSRYKTIETSLNKRYGNRWSGSLGFGYTMVTDFPNGPQRNPNVPGVDDRTLWNFKASGSYDAKFGIRLSPVLRHQSGSNFARTITVTAPTSCACTGTSNTGNTHYPEAMNSNREDNIWVFDVRAERQFSFGSRVRLRAMFDAFNLTNSHASETISRATGLTYLRPSAILAPRTARVGFRFIF